VRGKAKDTLAPLRSTLESATGGILVVDKSGKIVPFGQRFARMWRIPRRVVNQLAVESTLRRALERREFVVHYQPLARVSSGEIVGVEALARWEHPDRGCIEAGDFVPIAEETPIIFALDEWVLKTSCGRMVWRTPSSPPDSWPS